MVRRCAKGSCCTSHYFKPSRVRHMAFSEWESQDSDGILQRTVMHTPAVRREPFEERVAMCIRYEIALEAAKNSRSSSGELWRWAVIGESEMVQCFASIDPVSGVDWSWLRLFRGSAGSSFMTSAKDFRVLPVDLNTTSSGGDSLHCSFYTSLLCSVAVRSRANLSG